MVFFSLEQARLKVDQSALCLFIICSSDRVISI